MQRLEWSITSDYMWWTREDFLFTYDESEKQDNEINKNNAWLLFKPKYIVFRPQLLEAWLSINEALVYSFIDWYLRDINDKFYFTNEQIGNIFWFGEQAISNIIKRLKDKKFIDTSYRLKANWWKIRFIRRLYSDYNENYSHTITKIIDNNNKINSNNKNTSNSLNSFTQMLGKHWSGELTLSENVIERLYEYNNTRKKKLEKLTDKWLNLVINKLIELWHWTDEWMIAVLKQSVEKWWEWLFEVKWFKPKVDYENNLDLFLKRMRTDYEWLKNELGKDKFFELKTKALAYWAVNKLL